MQIFDFSVVLVASLAYFGTIPYLPRHVLVLKILTILKIQPAVKVVPWLQPVIDAFHDALRNGFWSLMLCVIVNYTLAILGMMYVIFSLKKKKKKWIVSMKGLDLILLHIIIALFFLFLFVEISGVMYGTLLIFMHFFSSNILTISLSIGPVPLRDPLKSFILCMGNRD